MEPQLPIRTAVDIETKAHILKSALKLFNEMSTDTVTLPEIAEASGLTTEILFSYFENKKAIIRALFFQIEVFSVKELWQTNPSNREVRFSDFMQFYFGSFAKFRFFFREFSILIQQDTILAAEWRRSYERLMSVMLEALNGWIKQGLVKPFNTQKDAETFIELIWIVASCSPIHLVARFGKAKPDYTKEVNNYVSTFLYPYHTEKGQRVLDLYM